MIKMLLHVFLGFVLCMRLAAKEPAKPSREQEEFNKEHLEKILTLYRDGRRKEALAASGPEPAFRESPVR